LRRQAAGAAIGETGARGPFPAGIGSGVHLPDGEVRLTKLDTGSLGVVLKRRGLKMSRAKYQRPEVHLWKGKGGEKFWKAQWRQYIEGRPKPKHRVMTWLCSDYSKSKAQAECDRIVREETGGAPRADGSMTVAEFWKRVFYPIVSRRLAPNSRASYESAYRVYIGPAIGHQELQHVIKHAVEATLGKIADSGKGKATIERVLMLIHEIFTEAVENGYVAKNPARRIVLPTCKDIQETPALTEQQVRTIFEKTEGRDYLMWRILLLTGLRPGELLALRKSDLIPAGICIDESSRWGHVGPTKNRKIRYAPIPAALRNEIEGWCKGVEGDLIFPNVIGGLLSRASTAIRGMLDRTRKAAAIPGLNFRQCRTTFATLYEGDPRDRQAIMGHHSAEFTMRVYQKPIAARQQASVEELDARLNGKVVTMPRRVESA
jgi:integrase